MKYLKAHEVEAALESVDVVAVLRDAFAQLADGAAVQPAQAVATLPEGGGDVIFYSAALGGSRTIGITVSPFLTALLDAGQPPVTAYTLVISAETGLPVLFCDSLPLITQRTGATTALAVDALVPEGAGRLALVGAGPIAESHLRHTRGLRPWTSIRVHSRNILSDAAAPRREAIARLVPTSEFVPELDEAVEDADVVLLCTSSETPVFDPRSLRPGALVTSITTDGPTAHEVPPQALRDLDVYCDYLPTTPSQAPEMVLAVEADMWNAGEIVADLSQLVSGQVQPKVSTDRVRFFRSIGLGVEDLAVAVALTGL